MKQKILRVFLAAALIMSLFAEFAVTVNAATTDGIYTYFVSNGGATITDCNSSVSGAITIPSTLGGCPVTAIGNWAFNDCESLTSVTIPDSVTSIGYSAFSYCSKLTSVTIPDSVTSIGEEAFFYCYRLTSVTIPDSVTSIGNSAFSDCSSLTSVTIPDSVTSIGDCAFSVCISLTSVTIPDSVTSIGNSAFSDCSGLTSVAIPDSVTTIGYMAFSCCYRLTSVTIPDSVTSIGDDAFSGCESLTSVTIPDSVTSIGDDAFSCCYSLTSVTIPDSVTTIGYMAFYYCYSLTDVYYSGSESQWNKIDIGRYNQHLTNATIHYNSDGSYISVKKDILLTKMALCRVVYDDLKKGTVNNLIKDGTITEATKRMFYNENTGKTIRWKTFIERYADEWEVIKTSENWTGFYAAAFRDNDSGDIIIAYRGSEDFGDWVTDGLMAIDVFGIPKQFKRALEFYDTVKKENKDANIELTGHSLGGALASYVSILREVKADNVNGATGWVFDDVEKNKIDPELLVEFKGSGNYIDGLNAKGAFINELYNEEDGTANKLVTMHNRGKFNYSLLETTPLYNEFKKGETLPKTKKDTHCISSILNYNNDVFSFTNVIENVEVDSKVSIVPGTIMGTTGDDTIESTQYRGNYLIDKSTGQPIMPSLGQLNEYQKNDNFTPYMQDNSNKTILCGDGNDTVKIFGVNDIVIGGAGNDDINGGAGNDTYYFGENWGSDTITDISGSDMLIFTDTSMSEFKMQKIEDYILLTAGENSVKVMSKGRQKNGSSMKIKASGEVSGDIFTTSLLSELMSADENTAKQLYISGTATLEIYDTDDNLLETITNNETAQIVGDYGEITLSNEDGFAFINGIFTENDYKFKITSDEAVVCTMSMNADSKDINCMTTIITEIPEGKWLETSTVPNENGKAEFNLLGGEDVETVENVSLQSVESIVVIPEKDTVYTGETINLSATILPENALAQSAQWSWESEEGVVGIFENEDGSTTLTAGKPGEVIIRATATDGSGIYGEATILVKSDAAHLVKVFDGDVPYVSGDVATNHIKIMVEDVEGYETVVDSNCEFDVDGNLYTVISNGSYNITIYGKNTTTNAITEKVTLNIKQEAPEIEFDGENKVLIYSEDYYENAGVFFAAYKDKKLISLKIVKNNIDIGKNEIEAEGFSALGADNIKILVWDGLQTLNSIFSYTE